MDDGGWVVRVVRVARVALVLAALIAPALGLAAPAQSARAQEPVGPWPTFRHDLSHTGRTQYSGPAAPDVKWAFAAEDGIASSPAIAADGTVYVGAGLFSIYSEVSADTCLYAINQDGTLKWRYPTRNGVFSSPAIGRDGTIYFGSLDNYVYALEDAGNYGSFKWRTFLGSYVFSSPAVGADGTVYVGSLNSRMYALTSTGSFKWNYLTGWCVFSSPAVGPDGDVCFGSKDHYLYDVEDAGTYGALKWRSPTGAFYDGHFVDSSPAIGADGTRYVGTDPYGGGGITPVPVDTVLFAVNPDGSLKWKFPMGDGAESSPAIGPDGTIYVGSYDGNLYAITDAGDAGVLKWVFPTAGAVDGSPAVDGCGVVYFGSRDSTVYAVNPDGALRWSLKTGGQIESSPSIDANGTLYVGSFDGHLYAIGDSGPDVGVWSIDLPREVRNDSTYLPLVTVRNYRHAWSGFGVSCLVDSAGTRVYADTAYVALLPETTSVQVGFAPWKVGINLGVEYTILVSTLLPGDNNSFNDTLTAPAETVPGTTGVGEHPPGAPAFASRCNPNPFSASTEIEFSLAERSHVTLKVFDISGRLVRLLVDEELPAGEHSGTRWDGKDDAGLPVASGIYFFQLAAPGRTDTKKVVLLR